MQSCYFNLILVFEVMLFGRMLFWRINKEILWPLWIAKIRIHFFGPVKLLVLYSFRVETLKNIGATLIDWLLSAISPWFWNKYDGRVIFASFSASPSPEKVKLFGSPLGTSATCRTIWRNERNIWTRSLSVYEKFKFTLILSVLDIIRW